MSEKEYMEFMATCIKEEMIEFAKGMAIYAALLGAYWGFVA
jgi:hypothetical protein